VSFVAIWAVCFPMTSGSEKRRRDREM
jgi:hypothetical protein